MNTFDCDILVVGGGAAGARAAYEAKRTDPGLKVLMAVAGSFGLSGSTNLIASESLGINAPFNFMNDGDSPDVFYQDIIETGAGLSNPILARVIADEACDRLNELMTLGLAFDAKDGQIIQRKLSGCTKARSLTCGGSTGKEMVRILKEQMSRLGVAVQEKMRVVDLVQDDEGRICGVRALTSREAVFIRSKAIILANGGAGRIFRHNVNPPTLEGDGWSMAYRAGARLINLEFFQVGPAVFNAPLMFIIHSHMWRLRPRLTNALGQEFLSRYCPAGLSPDDVLDLKAMSYPFSVRTAAKVLDIAIFREILEGRATASGGVYFDLTHIDRETLTARAPITYKTLLRAGLDLSCQRIEIGPVVQNFNGGIFIDGNSFTGVEGLYAVGEVSGGVHGADRPGGNNLIDTQVFGYRAGIAAARYAASSKRKGRRPGGLAQLEIKPLSNKDKKLIEETSDLFYSNLTIIRSKKGLTDVLDLIDRFKENTNLVLRNRLTVGSLLATAALTREESRGTHYREDFPATDPHWEKRIVLSQGQDGLPKKELLP